MGHFILPEANGDEASQEPQEASSRNTLCAFSREVIVPPFHPLAKVIQETEGVEKALGILATDLVERVCVVSTGEGGEADVSKFATWDDALNPIPLPSGYNDGDTLNIRVIDGDGVITTESLSGRMFVTIPCEPDGSEPALLISAAKLLEALALAKVISSLHEPHLPGEPAAIMQMIYTWVTISGAKPGDGATHHLLVFGQDLRGTFEMSMEHYALFCRSVCNQVTGLLGYKKIERMLKRLGLRRIIEGSDFLMRLFGLSSEKTTTARYPIEVRDENDVVDLKRYLASLKVSVESAEAKAVPSKGQEEEAKGEKIQRKGLRDEMLRANGWELEIAQVLEASSFVCATDGYAILKSSREYVLYEWRKDGTIHYNLSLPGKFDSVSRVYSTGEYLVVNSSKGLYKQSKDSSTWQSVLGDDFRVKDFICISGQMLGVVVAVPKNHREEGQGMMVFVDLTKSPPRSLNISEHTRMNEPYKVHRIADGLLAVRQHYTFYSVYTTGNKASGISAHSLFQSVDISDTCITPERYCLISGTVYETVKGEGILTSVVYVSDPSNLRYGPMKILVVLPDIMDKKVLARCAVSGDTACMVLSPVGAPLDQASVVTFNLRKFREGPYEKVTLSDLLQRKDLEPCLIRVSDHPSFFRRCYTPGSFLHVAPVAGDGFKLLLGKGSLRLRLA